MDGQKGLVELAVVDDREQVMWRVLGREFADHLAVPMSLMLVFVFGGMLLSIRFALAPLQQAAAEAEKIDPFDATHRLKMEGMPREVAKLGEAVNRTLDRVRALVEAQRLFVTAVAHEVRTPLAMMKLELDHFDDPRARKMEGDIDDLARLVGQLTALGRLESADRAGFKRFALAATARKAVADIAPWVYERQASISFADHGAHAIVGHEPLIADAIRNLIENAIKHTPRGTTIKVAVGPGERVTISDDAGLFPGVDGEEPAPRDRFGVGLEIVRRIMTLHRGGLQTAVAPGERTTMILDFEPAAVTKPQAQL
jgi:signal transduction histidine kinase